MLLKQQRELMASGLVSKDQMSEAMRSEAGKKGGVLLALLEMNSVNDAEVLSALARMYKVPYLDIEAFKPMPDAIKLCDEKLCLDFAFIPLEVQGNDLVIATDNPVDFNMLDSLRFKLGKRIKPIFARPDMIAKKIREIFQGDAAFDAAMQALDETGGFEAELEENTKRQTANLDELKRGAEDSPIIKLVNGIIIQAMKIGSSDIHIEPGEKQSIVRLRVDGRLRPSLKFPANVHQLVASRIKIMSSLDISNSRSPQDGRTRIKLWGKSYDMRVSTLPAMHGEKVVIRILDKSGLSLSLEALGFAPSAERRVRECIERPTGAVLVTGPTGSGKTTTLYSFLHHVQSEENNIITVEDPVEFQIKGINQVQVNPKANMTFASALRSILRQDPDVVMVGEIRDQETAAIALHAAQTGHLVMSTLHTNDAPSTITRLVEMGIEPALLASSVNLIVAQRLVRRLCPKCKHATLADVEIAQRFDIPEGIEFFQGHGCEACGKTGYKGRIAIHEVLYMNDRMRKLVAEGAHDRELMQAARDEGMLTMFADGVAKAMQGRTSLQEVMRAASVPEEFSLRKRLGDNKQVVPLDVMRKSAEDAQSVQRQSDGKKLILIVDDSASIRNLVKFVLEADGYEIVQAEDGLEAWNMVQRLRPNLVIADCDMPNMTGPELVQRMREMQEFNDTPIVLLTSKKDEEDEVFGLEVGADDYIGKPVEPLKLQARVKKTLAMYARIRQAMQGE